MKIVKNILVTALAACTVSLSATADAANYELISPVADSQSHFQQRSISLTPAYILNSQAVKMNLGTTTFIEPKTFLNQTFKLKFAEDKEFEVIFTEAEIQSDFLFVKGRLVDGEWLNTTMTIGDGGYLITFDDNQSGETYRLSGSLADGQGQLTNVDAIMLDEQQQHQHASHLISFANY